jgi:hypothetical protein
VARTALGWALFSSYLLVPTFVLARPGDVHYGLAGSTASAGLIMLTLAAGQAAAGPAAGAVSRRSSARAVFAAGLLLVAAGLGWLSVIRGGLPPNAAALLLVGAGAGAALQSSSSVATQGVSSDVAAASSALNSTIRRFAGGVGGVGGQVSIILLASLTFGGSSQPRFAAFTVAYLTGAGLCCAGAAIVWSGRPGSSGDDD